MTWCVQVPKVMMHLSVTVSQQLDERTSQASLVPSSPVGNGTRRPRNCIVLILCCCCCNHCHCRHHCQPSRESWKDIYSVNRFLL